MTERIARQPAGSTIAPNPPSEPDRLRGNIGTSGVVFMVVAAAAPLTVVGGALPVMLGIGNGPGTPVAFLVVTVVLLLFSIGYAAMSRFVVDTGAFYAYVRRGLGVRTGTGAAGLALLTYTAVQASVYGLASATLSELIVSWGGPRIDWWVLGLALLAVIAFLGYRSIDVGAKVLGVMLVLELSVVLAMSIAILIRGGAAGIEFTSFSPGSFFSGSPGIALMFAITSFIGFEATAIYGEEAKNPERTVPRATYISVLLIGGLYAFASWAIVLAFGSANIVDVALSDPTGLTMTAADANLVGWASHVIRILLLTSLFAALLAFHNAISRYFFALGRQGVAPRRLASTHPRHGSPYLGSVTQSVMAAGIILVFAVCGLDPVLQIFTWMSGLATMSMIALLLLTSTAVLAFFLRGSVDRRIWNTKLAPTLAIIGLVLVAGAAVANFTTLIAGSPTLAATMYLIISIAFIGGVLACLLTEKNLERGTTPGCSTSSQSSTCPSLPPIQ